MTVCHYCQSTPSTLLTCSGCHTVRYCSRDHQRLDWKQHRARCRTPPSSEAGASTASAPVMATKSMAEMKAEREAALHAATLGSEAQSPFTATTTTTTTTISSANELDASNLPGWSNVLWSRIQALYQQADGLLESSTAANTTRAIALLTQSLHLHAALPVEYPKSVLKNLYSYRSVAFLSLATLPHLAVYDAITSLRCDRDYVHSFGVIHNAWKQFGNLTKARQAAEQGLKQANDRALPALAKRFELMMQNIDSTLTTTTTTTTDSLTVETRNLSLDNVSDRQQTLYRESIERSLHSSSLYHLPHSAVLKSLSFLFPTNSWDATQQLYWSKLTEGKGYAVQCDPVIGRHLVATREYKAGSTVLIETPTVSGCYVEDVCVQCWRTLDREHDSVVNPVYCVNECRHELYCSVKCRDSHSERHSPLCGHSWHDLRERVSETVTTSGSIWLLVASMMGMAITEVKKHEKELRSAAIKLSLTKTSESEALTEPSSILGRLPALALLQSHYELPPAYLASMKHDFDQVWAMSTLLTHWFITTPAMRATDTSTSTSKIEPEYNSASALSLLPYVDYALVEQLYSKCLLNAHALHSSLGKQCFIALGQLSSLLTHSCFPALTLRSDGQQVQGKLIFVANHAIKKGDVLTISYVGDSVLRGDRVSRAQSLIPYGFVCDCSRCKREKLTDKQATALSELKQQHGLGY